MFSAGYDRPIDALESMCLSLTSELKESYDRHKEVTASVLLSENLISAITKISNSLSSAI